MDIVPAPDDPADPVARERGDATARDRVLQGLSSAASLVLLASLALPWLTSAQAIGSLDPDLATRALVVGFVGGFSGGLIGLGGGLLVVPLSAFFLGFPWHLAVGTSAFQGFFSYSVAALGHHRQGNVRFRLALPLLVGAAVGAPLGALVSLGLSETTLTWVFLTVLAAVMLHVAIDHLRGGRRDNEGIDLTQRIGEDGRRRILRSSQRLLGRRLGSLLVVTLTTPIQGSFAGHRYRIDRITPLLMGGGVGFFSGLLGVGGGFLLIPLIASGLSLPAHLAVGTGLVVVTGNALFGGVTHLLHSNVSLLAAALLAVGGMVGAALGSRCSEGLSEKAIKGLFLVVLGAVCYQVAPVGLV